ncbi:unnamed protein product [Caenorhabditis auriculariae]|uniref:Tc1-like transposase DDE domain-containing protein n=1 Tax=Caenorhabditis auriculariae TaxID=2777116 RepID=A0A8S1GZC6_9PELO|nr:unnamed protein product [Caenorhabditis auriculariae]
MDDRPLLHQQEIKKVRDFTSKNPRRSLRKLPEKMNIKWPPYSPDLNPMYYSVWNVLESKACTSPHQKIEPLKASLEQNGPE